MDTNESDQRVPEAALDPVLCVKCRNVPPTHGGLLCDECRAAVGGRRRFVKGRARADFLGAVWAYELGVASRELFPFHTGAPLKKHFLFAPESDHHVYWLQAWDHRPFRFDREAVTA